MHWSLGSVTAPRLPGHIQAIYHRPPRRRYLPRNARRSIRPTPSASPAFILLRRQCHYRREKNRKKLQGTSLLLEKMGVGYNAISCAISKAQRPAFLALFIHLFSDCIGGCVLMLQLRPAGKVRREKSQRLSPAEL